ncbi:MAG: protein-export chaperone SecB [Deltaproteobacteria bacterium]
MTEKTAPPQQNDYPVFRLQKMFLKDLSFENPNAPDIYLAKIEEPKIDLKLGLKHNKLENDHWEVILTITADLKNKSDEKTIFIIEAEHAGIFLLKNIPEEHLPRVLGVDCPTYLFPFTRQILAQATIDGGFPPFLMEPINFHALFENAQRERRQKMA